MTVSLLRSMRGFWIDTTLTVEPQCTPQMVLANEKLVNQGPLIVVDLASYKPLQLCDQEIQRAVGDSWRKLGNVVK